MGRLLQPGSSGQGDLREHSGFCRAVDPEAEGLKGNLVVTAGPQMTLAQLQAAAPLLTAAISTRLSEQGLISSRVPG